MTDEIDDVVDDLVATITLCRPATLNAVTNAMLGAFREAVDAAAADPRVIGIVVTGEGRGFCSGLDASVRPGGRHRRRDAERGEPVPRGRVADPRGHGCRPPARAHGRGLIAVDLHAADQGRAGDETTICGVRFRLV